ncbi:hypothetical protein C1G86_0682 [Dehalococcoides mccartyi]|uniref:Uncharacterized protein n=1 Tax=Dehalococcoides mccartyi TaxID=61435 RepID=A0A328EUA2_9CHLR|nr:hypothetical protein C1G86_0682 [Dehalococcoides mccartyi]
MALRPASSAVLPASVVSLIVASLPADLAAAIAAATSTLFFQPV